MAKTRRRPNKRRNNRKSYKPRKSHKTRNIRKKPRKQRGGALTANDYADMWKQYIKDGTIRDLTLEDQQHFVLTRINPWIKNDTDPSRNLVTFVKGILKADNETWRHISLPHGSIPDDILGPVLHTIAERTPYIARLNIVECPELKDDHLAQLYFGGAANIDEIDLQGCVNLTVHATEIFQVYQPVYLNLSRIPAVGDEWIDRIIAGPPPEEGGSTEADDPGTPFRLILDSQPNNSNKLTNLGVAMIASAAPGYLKYLSIRHNDRIDFGAIWALVQAYGQVAHLMPAFPNFIDLTGCPKIREQILSNPNNPNFQNPFAFMGLVRDPVGRGTARWATQVWFDERARQRRKNRGR